MDYTKFGEVVEQKSPIELHKTDYNNYSDLSHFIEQYNIAQKLIQESKNFYRSFLVSKLMTFEQLINYKYLDHLNLVIKHEYESLKPGAWSRYDTETKVYYTDFLIDIYYWYLHNGIQNSMYDSEKRKNLKIYDLNDIPKYKKEINKLNKEVDNIDIEFGKLLKNGMTFEEAKMLSRSINEEHWNVIDEPNSYSSYWLYSTIVDLMSGDVKRPRFVRDNMLETFNELKKVHGELFNKIVELYNKRKSLEQKSLNITYSIEYSQQVNKQNRLNKFLDLCEELGISHKKIDIEIENFKDKLDTIHEFIIADIREFKSIPEIPERRNYYIIDENKQPQYFGNSLSNVDIKLSGDQKELICKYSETESHKKWAWPSDAPTIRTTTTNTIVFDTTNNEIKSFFTNSDSIEISNKRY